MGGMQPSALAYAVAMGSYVLATLSSVNAIYMCGALSWDYTCDAWRWRRQRTFYKGE